VSQVFETVFQIGGGTMSDIPEELMYTQDHEWLKVDGDTGFVGITDFAQGELGDIVFVELPGVGDSISKGHTFGTVEAVKTVADLYAPVSGEVVGVNEGLAENAEAVNSDAYGDGWMVEVRLADLGELDDLMSAEAYKKMIADGS